MAAMSSDTSLTGRITEQDLRDLFPDLMALPHPRATVLAVKALFAEAMLGIRTPVPMTDGGPVIFKYNFNKDKQQ